MNGPSASVGSHKVRALLAPYGVDASEGLSEMIRVYMSTLSQWNSKVSLTTVTDPEEVVRFHFGESLFAVSKMNIVKGRLADIGTGPGFPGIPIRMVSPDIHLTLVESNSKKAAFLCEVARKLGLPGISVIRQRMEEIGAGQVEDFDFITARALGKYEDLLKWSKSHLAPDGRIVLWLGSEESREISSTPGWKWQDSVMIPGSRSRFLLSGSPV
jgi:16S rRNA (guanine527-N7)-methyltransferase